MSEDEKTESTMNKVRKALLDYLSPRQKRQDDLFSFVSHPVSMIALSEWADGQITDELMEGDLLKHKVHIDNCERCAKAIRYYRQQKNKKAVTFPPL